jgi:hypothetical protein
VGDTNATLPSAMVTDESLPHATVADGTLPRAMVDPFIMTQCDTSSVNFGEGFIPSSPTAFVQWITKPI